MTFPIRLSNSQRSARPIFEAWGAPSFSFLPRRFALPHIGNTRHAVRGEAERRKAQPSSSTRRSVARPWRRTPASRRSTAASSCRQPLAPNTGVGPRFAGLSSSPVTIPWRQFPSSGCRAAGSTKGRAGLRQRAPRARLVVAGGRGPDAARVRGCVPCPRAPHPAPPSDASRRRPR
jgi:hypothetical protein